MVQSYAAHSPEKPGHSVREWVQEVTTVSDLELKSRIVTFLLLAFGGALAATLGMFLLQGFSHLTGFSLDRESLRWLGGATIGELSGLLAVAIKQVFGKKR